MTLHAAKGLEFPVVFIVGLEDGILPLHWSDPDDKALAEERRLFYVGMTRAKDHLVLSRALQRQWRGKLQRLEPSPFLRDIETELTKHQPMHAVRRKAAAAVLSSHFIRLGRYSEICGNAIKSVMITTSQARNQ